MLRLWRERDNVTEPERCHNCDHLVKNHNVKDGCNVYQGAGATCDCPYEFSKQVNLVDAQTVGIKSLTIETVANPERVKASDRQVGGDHYRQTPIQPWDIVDAFGLGFYAGNALKYLLRAGRKGDAQAKVDDLAKAKHYIEKMIELEGGEG